MISLYYTMIMIGILFTTTVTMTGCYDNDDFAPYTHCIEELSEYFTDEKIISLSDIIPDANEIAVRYANGLVLTKVSFVTEDFGLTGNVQFHYTKVHETPNQATSVKISFDIENKKFYNIEYEQGHSKRVSIITEQVSNQYLNMTFEELFTLDEMEHAGSKSINIELSFDRISIYFIDA